LLLDELNDLLDFIDRLEKSEQLSGIFHSIWKASSKSTLKLLDYEKEGESLFY